MMYGLSFFGTFLSTSRNRYRFSSSWLRSRHVHRFSLRCPTSAGFFQNGTFWDFCYEHCNYFTPDALRYALMRAGYRVQDQLTLFSGQFQGAVGVPDPSQPSAEAPSGMQEVAIASAYATSETARMQAAREMIEQAGDGAVLWGMATKGVVFASLITAPLAGGVDVNPKKQHHFAPGSGLPINPPEWLSSLGGTPTIFIMNGNYAHEIRHQVSDLGLTAHFVNL